MGHPIFPLLFVLFLTTIVNCHLTKSSYSSSLFVEDDEPIVKQLGKSRNGREEFIVEDTKIEGNTDVSVEDSEIPNNSSGENVVTKGVEARVSYSGAQVWKFRLSNLQVLNELNKLNQEKEIGWWGGNITYIDMMVKPSSRQVAHEILTNYQVPYEIIINDLQDAIDNENPQFDEEAELANRKGHRMTWQSYHRLADIHGYLDYLANTYPDLCSTQVIGKSVEGRELKILKISNGNADNKAIWIDGGIHAREWISPASVTYIINQIVEGYENESSDIKSIDWYFLPVLNPDGYEYTHKNDRLWRKNRGKSFSGACAGTDLNRNFGYRWGGKGNSKNPCAETYGGRSAFSEPEARAVKTFFESANVKFKAYLSFHSYGQFILYPWGYENVVPPDHMDLQRVGQKMAQAIRTTGGATYKVGSSANLLYPASGGSDDWAKAYGVKYSYTIELRDSGRYGFVLPASFITVTAKEALAAVRVVAAAVVVTV